MIRRGGTEDIYPQLHKTTCGLNARRNTVRHNIGRGKEIRLNDGPFASGCGVVAKLVAANNSNSPSKDYWK